jgi:large subunit ribosomal protein L29
MKPGEMRAKPAAELKQLKEKMEKELMDARFKNITGQLKNKGSVRKIRRDIARINTILKESGK